jgi:hypothetical protein
VVVVVAGEVVCGGGGCGGGCGLLIVLELLVELLIDFVHQSCVWCSTGMNATHGSLRATYRTDS